MILRYVMHDASDASSSKREGASMGIGVIV